jgi:hypothetical protein
VAGIINGTTNFILSEMRAKGLDFGAVLKEAQRLGYAEADPSFDIVSEVAIERSRFDCLTASKYSGSNGFSSSLPSLSGFGCIGGRGSLMREVTSWTSRADTGRTFIRTPSTSKMFFSFCVSFNASTIFSLAIFLITPSARFVK